MASRSSLPDRNQPCRAEWTRYGSAMQPDAWSTLDEIHAALGRFTAAIPGWETPAGYGIGIMDAGDSRQAAFPVVNVGAHRLPAVVMSTVLKHVSGTAAYRFGPAEFDDALAQLAPAEACTDEQHPNLWSWRELRATGAPEFVAVFVGSFDDPALDPVDRVFRRRVRQDHAVTIAGGWQRLLQEQFRAIEAGLDEAVGRRSEAELRHTAPGSPNSIAWLTWHIARSFDRNISEVAGETQRWMLHGWADQFDLPADRSNTGYQHTIEQVRAFPTIGADVLLAYLDTVMAMVERYLNNAPDDDLTRLSESPSRAISAPVSERLTEELGEGFQHLGQINLI